MGSRGTKPGPTALKLVKGVKPGRVNRSEPIPVDADRCPPLSDDAMEHWDRLAPELRRQGVLKANDVEAFGRFCTALADWWTARAHIDSEGAVVEAPVFNKNGDITGHRLQRNQWWLVAKDADDALLRLGARFGMTPSDRSQLKVGGDATSDASADLLTG